MFKTHFIMDLGSWKSVVAEIVDNLRYMCIYVRMWFIQTRLKTKSRDSSFHIPIEYGPDDHKMGNNSGEGWEFLSSAQCPDGLWEPTKPPVQWKPWALSLGAYRPVGESDRSPPSNAEFKEKGELYTHPPDTSSLLFA